MFYLVIQNVLYEYINTSGAGGFVVDFSRQLLRVSEIGGCETNVYNI